MKIIRQSPAIKKLLSNTDHWREDFFCIAGLVFACSAL